MTETVHATCVAWQGRGLLIMGASGSGKSGLALSLMAWGCDLVGDDRVRLTATAEGLIAAPVPNIAGMIEARGLGILNADHIDQAAIAYVVDLDQTEAARLPPRRSITLMGCDLPLIYRAETPDWASSLLQLLKADWSDR